MFIGIDAPDFNLGLERWLKQRGIRTVHYVSPSVWAWREKRAAKIGRQRRPGAVPVPDGTCDLCAARHRRALRRPPAGGCVSRCTPTAAPRDARWACPPDVPVLALLPGSRLGEIGRLLPTFLEAAQHAGRADAGPGGADSRRERRLPGSHRARTGRDVAAPTSGCLHGQAHQAMIASDVVLLASGTAALEAMLAKRPMVVGYRISALTYRLVMALGLMNVNRYSLPNVLANEPIVPELMQGDCTPENLLEALLPCFNDAAGACHLAAALPGNPRAPARAMRRMRRPRRSRTFWNDRDESASRVAGVDEAGRGPLAGPVVCAAVILDPRRPIAGLERFQSLERAVARAPVSDHSANLPGLACRIRRTRGNRRAQHPAGPRWRECAAPSTPLPPRRPRALIDGDRVPDGLPCPAEALVGGDGLEPSIMAASILAKVSRDRHMLALARSLSRLWFRAKQGLSDGRTPGFAGATRPLRGAPPQLRSGAQ